MCRSIGRIYGQLPRFGLVNETAVLALLLDAISGGNRSLKIENRGCIAHPHKKCRSVVCNRCTDFCAGVNVILVVYKLKDSYADDHKISAKIGSAALHRAHRHVCERLPAVAECVRQSIAALSALEQARCGLVDQAAEPFADMMRKLFFLGLREVMPAAAPEVLEAARVMGYHMGKWIYLVDALTDREADAKTGSYNVFLLQEAGEEDILFLLEMCLARCCEAWSELRRCFPVCEQNKDAAAVIENMLYIGMRHTTERLFRTGDTKEPSLQADDAAQTQEQRHQAVPDNEAAAERRE